MILFLWLNRKKNTSVAHTLFLLSLSCSSTKSIAIGLYKCEWECWGGLTWTHRSWRVFWGIPFSLFSFSPLKSCVFSFILNVPSFIKSRSSFGIFKTNKKKKKKTKFEFNWIIFYFFNFFLAFSLKNSRWVAIYNWIPIPKWTDAECAEVMDRLARRIPVTTSSSVIDGNSVTDSRPAPPPATEVIKHNFYSTTQCNMTSSWTKFSH